MLNEKWHRRAAITVSVAGIVAAAYLFCRFALTLFLPFLIAFGLAALTRSVALRFSAHSRIPQKVSAVLFTVLALFAAGVGLYFLTARLLLELQHLLTRLLADIGNPDGTLSALFRFFEGLAEKLRFSMPWLEDLVGEPGSFLAERLKGWLEQLSEEIPAGIMRLLSALPSVLLFSLVTLISCFYFAVEYDAVIVCLSGVLPAAWRQKLPDIKERAGGLVGRYFRAYFLIFLLTFAELFLGFVLLRTEYAFLLALLVALLDILPVLGVGTFLIPFSLIAFITGNPFRGIGLLVLYVIITVVRQIVEPHLVGKCLGLHPILMLVAFYAGVKLFGFPGLFVGPLLAVALKLFFDRQKERAP